ncbi:hypothetical protein ACP70R_008563 [Stipagrostis hirtigluma subsp. patula]
MATPNGDGAIIDLESGGGGVDALPGAVGGAAGANANAIKKTPNAKATTRKPNTTPVKKTTNKTPAKEERGSSNSYTGAALLMLVMYYLFFVFYMFVFSEKWWHAAIAIPVATAFMLLSFCLATSGQNDTTPGESRAVKPPGGDRDLGRRLLEPEKLEEQESGIDAVRLVLG